MTRYVVMEGLSYEQITEVDAHNIEHAVRLVAAGREGHYAAAAARSYVEVHAVPDEHPTPPMKLTPSGGMRAVLPGQTTVEEMLT